LIDGKLMEMGQPFDRSARVLFLPRMQEINTRKEADSLRKAFQRFQRISWWLTNHSTFTRSRCLRGEAFVNRLSLADTDRIRDGPINMPAEGVLRVLLRPRRFSALTNRCRSAWCDVD
jgi:hypothetical protein